MDKKLENDKPVKNRKRFSLILNSSIIVFSVVLLAVEGVVYYQRSYLTPFWVNGQSMYPTLNGDARDANGNKLDETSGSAHPGYTVDYGVMDCHERAIKKIKRFDIVVTKYTKEDTSNKIKRVLGLPGETVEFKNDGDLYIDGKYYEQPLKSEFIKGAAYPTQRTKFGDDEYYVCGDNRKHSFDSTEVGAIKREYITGKAVAICGTAEVCLDSSNLLDIKNIKYSWPKWL